jgi:hypothetical protein
MQASDDPSPFYVRHDGLPLKRMNLTGAYDSFQDGEREDTTLMLFQVWLFILGVTGLLQDSIPHMAANLGGQIMNTAWAGFRISSLLKARGIYISTVVDGACGGADALAATWSRRIVESVRRMMSPN